MISLLMCAGASAQQVTVLTNVKIIDALIPI